MLDQGTRHAILQLAKRGHSARRIAAELGVARASVRACVASGTSEVARIERREKAEPFRREILELLARCGGNLVRVHEELVASGAELSYQALTGFCRRHQIGQEPKQPAGHYHFAPGEEMQHDTSPHRVRLGGSLRRVQTASLVLCHSRMLFFQFSPRFRRFECKVFLTEALSYMGGACASCMIDNTHVVVLKGTGARMQPVPEMEAFAIRFGFAWRAHEVGDANRSGRVERPFGFIEGNFLAGRAFADWAAANAEARAWCDRVNATYKKHLKAVPRELYAVERAALRPLPIWVPEPYLLHHRVVDCDAYVTVEANRYSVPAALIGRRVEVRETDQHIRIYDGPREVTCHDRERDALGRHILRPEHRQQRPPRRRAEPASEEVELLRLVPELADYVAGLKLHGPVQTTLALRRLLAMVREYPREVVVEQIRAAGHYGLYDLGRVERMILGGVVTEYFGLRPEADLVVQGDDTDADTQGVDRGTAPIAREPAPGADGGDPA